MKDTTQDELPTQETVNIFLDDLRESGVTNMNGAGTFIQNSFDVTKYEANRYLVKWIDTVAERHNDSERS